MKVEPFPVELVFEDASFSRYFEVAQEMSLAITTGNSSNEVAFAELTLNLKTHFLLPVTTAQNWAGEEKDRYGFIVENLDKFLWEDNFHEVLLFKVNLISNYIKLICHAR